MTDRPEWSGLEWHWRAGSTAEPLAGGVRAGADLVAVAQVEMNLERFGERYTEHVFTARELKESAGESLVVTTRSLAARFAAKEATFKVLRVGDHRPVWTDVEVRRLAGGACTLALHGAARTMAERIGITDLAVALSHEGDVALVFVVALCREPQGREENETSWT